MTALRPEHEAGYGASYEQGGYEVSGAFEAAVDGLADPLKDPLPGQPGQPGRPGEAQGRGQGQSGEQGQQPVRKQGRHRGPRQPEPVPEATAPGPEWSGDYYRQYATEAPRGPESGTPSYYADGTAPMADTARIPVSEPAPVPVPVPEPRLDDQTVGLRTADTRRAVEPEPVTGGRAERRRAAKGGGRGRRRAEPAGASGADAGQGSEEQAPARPLSRVEARRAARALKESPAVIASRAVGELFITFGVLMLLFVTYQLWWTNVRADQYAGNETNKIQDSWTKDRQPGAFEPGQGFAIMHIPKLDVVVPIAEGINKSQVLDRGMVGHYAEGRLKTAMPSDKQGNFAVAGHRNTHGEPFRYINQLKPGDEIIVETRDAYYTYDMASILPQTSPSNVSVIGPVPPGSGFTEPGRYITLTTCTPEFTSTYRLIVWGKMVDERPRSKGKPDALVG
ncbi:class E sortase [Streptomyces sp. 35G-GA-8]|uniref:class E sortase n=1 Tax=Streptomyces sp. 35G-GA-8 TaxID=2939434 RepID=UPI00201F47BB|nr:class E sortase [Streptomyces sp. 35G-GA-8]MCL7379484.1 class E sortase [Streptomyces sp. 35G-GA-8]